MITCNSDHIEKTLIEHRSKIDSAPLIGQVQSCLTVNRLLSAQTRELCRKFGPFSKSTRTYFDDKSPAERVMKLMSWIRAVQAKSDFPFEKLALYLNWKINNIFASRNFSFFMERTCFHFSIQVQRLLSLTSSQRSVC